MEYYNIPENPVYSEEIRRLKNSDPASADPTFNPLISRLIENTAAVKADNTAGQGELEAHANNTEIHVSAEQTEVYRIAASDLGKHVINEDIHVNAEKQLLWTGGTETAELGKEQARLAMEKALKNERDIAALEISLYSNITKNPFSLGFDTLAKIKLIKGVWNKGQQRIEC